MSLPVINAIWIGPRLGRMAANCLRSFAQVGHRTVLHVYEKLEDAPDGVELADAALTLPPSEIIRYRRQNSFALFANLFRYKLMAHDAGVYVDCDVFCLRPVEQADYIFGRQDRRTINNAVMRLPPDAPMTKALAAIRNDGTYVAPWLSPFSQQRLHLRRMVGRPKSLEDMPWGYAGFKAVNYFAEHFDVAKLAQPSDVFYPVGPRNIDLLYDPDLTIEDVTTHRTRCVHLFNENLIRYRRGEAPASSPIGRMLAMADG